jgi:hypothetical protein
MITGVAVRLVDGTVLALSRPARHWNLSLEHNNAHREDGMDVPWVGWSHALMDDNEQGFVDETGAFLTREEAAKHAIACGQITDTKFQPDKLFSEDLW